jgi:hypothetical protein
MPLVSIGPAGVLGRKQATPGQCDSRLAVASSS